MRSVVLCRSNSVRPHDGHETNSVFVMRTPAACRMLNSSRERLLVRALARSGRRCRPGRRTAASRGRSRCAAGLRARRRRRASCRCSGWSPDGGGERAVRADGVVPRARAARRRRPDDRRRELRPLRAVEDRYRVAAPPTVDPPTSTGARDATRVRVRVDPLGHRRRTLRPPAGPALYGATRRCATGTLGLGLLGQRDADRVAQAVVEQRADADRGLDAAVLAEAGLGHARGAAGTGPCPPRPCAPPAGGRPGS